MSKARDWVKNPNIPRNKEILETSLKADSFRKEVCLRSPGEFLDLIVGHVRAGLYQ